MAIRILTDSGSDYEQNEIEKKNIDVIPIPIDLNGISYFDGIDLTKNQFFKIIEESGSFPKTAQPSPSKYLDYFENARKNGDEVVAIILSSSLSGMYQTVCLCKEQGGYENVYIIDSLNATAGIRLLADTAVKLREEGKSALQIAGILNSLKRRIRLYATFPTLKYLVKGGRLSRFEASAAAIARLKPVITIGQEGEVYVCHKGVGIKHSLDYMAQKIAEEQIDENYPVFPIYSSDCANCKIMLSKIAARGINISEELMTNIGPTIGSYVGIGAAGIVYVKKS
ncbi:DegV domain-containing protein [Clostridiales bacterium]|nr:DegV domain-containing protein [Clostridiales bacterium]